MLIGQNDISIELPFMSEVPHDVDTDKEPTPVGSGVLYFVERNPLHRRNGESYRNASLQAFLSPPPLAHKLPVNHLQAESVARTILQQIAVKWGSGSTGSVGDFGNKPNLDGNQGDISALSTTIILALINGFAKIGNLQALCTQIRTQGAETIQQKQNAEVCKQCDEAIANADKAKKSGLFGLLVDLFSLIVDAVSGIASIVEGIFTMNPATIAGGAAFLAAAAVNVASVVIDAINLADSSLGAKLSNANTILHDVSTGIEVAGVVLTIVGVGLAVKAASAGVKGAAKEAMAKIGEDALSNTAGFSKEGAQALAKGFVKEMGSELFERTENIAMRATSEAAEEVTSEVVESASEELTNRILGGVADAIQKEAPSFIRRAFDPKMVAKVLEEAAQKSVSKFTEGMTKEAFKKILIKTVSSFMTRQMIRMAFRSTVFLGFSISKGVISGANTTFKGVIMKEQAEQQKEMGILQAYIDYLAALLKQNMSLADNAKQSQNSTIKNITNLAQQEADVLKREFNVKLQMVIGMA